ncbi:MAG TPA: long-chain fatty acid--CoA ligase [Terriglobia bacterium]|nr:long-chain fatty acid--CoA ligase [Terriglobia bacterium]
MAPYETINQIFITVFSERPKPDAFLTKIDGRYQPVSSAEALQQVSALAAALERLGVQRGDRVAILSENRLEWALTDYAVLGLGAADVPIYSTQLEHDIGYILRDSGSKGIVVSSAAQLRKVAHVRPNLPDLQFIIVMDPVDSPAPGVFSWHRLVGDELARFTRPVDLVEPFRQRALEVRPEEIASIIYTSGTTGEPKGVVLLHSNIVANVRSCEALYKSELGKDDVSICLLPLSHIFERMLDYTVLWFGVSTAYPESFDALPQNMLEVRPTMLAVVPRVLEKIRDRVMEKARNAPPARQKLFHWALKVGYQYFPYVIEGKAPPLGLRLKHSVADALVGSKIRAGVGGRLKFVFSGAAPLSRDIAEFFYAVGVPVYEGYGLTETSPVIAVNYPGAVRLGTVGRLLPGVEVKLGEESVDEENRHGREILVRGANVSPGYYRLDGENQRAFADGWFHSGDLGKFDDDGFLMITGRKKNLFKTSGGKYISPEKLENLFQGHPYVAQIVVLGEARHFVSALVVPNFERLETYARAMEIVCADRDGLVRDVRIHTFMQQQVDATTAPLPQYERIHQIGLLAREFTIEAGELSPTQKVKRHVVAERYRDLIEEVYQRHAPQPQSA